MSKKTFFGYMMVLLLIFDQAAIVLLRILLPILHIFDPRYFHRLTKIIKGAERLKSIPTSLF